MCEFNFFVNKNKMDNVSLYNIKNTYNYNAFYTILNNNKDRIDINLTSSTFKSLSELYYEQLSDDPIISIDVVIDVLIDVISETIQHEYLHKAMGKTINIEIERSKCDHIIEKLING